MNTGLQKHGIEGMTKRVKTDITGLSHIPITDPAIVIQTSAA
jgi:hypothetical protein